MKVLAKAAGNSFICEVNEVEVKKFLNTYYSHVTAMEVGSEVNLAKGYNFASDTRDALKKTEEFISSNKNTIEAIINGINIFGVNNPEETHFINSRIEEIALKHCADYPNIKNETRAGRLYAIDSTLEGISLANKDLHKVIENLRIKNNMTEDDLLELIEELKSVS